MPRPTLCACACVRLLILSSFTFILSILCPWGASGLRLPSKLSQIEFRLAGRYRPHPDRLERGERRERGGVKTITAHITRLKTFPLISLHAFLFYPASPSLPLSLSLLRWFPCCLSFFCRHIILLLLLLYITPCVSSPVFVCWYRYTSFFPFLACLFLSFDDSLPSCSSPSLLSLSIPSH